jgi:hypothetical protein
VLFLLQDISDYEGYDMSTAPAVIIPSEAAGGMVIVGGALGTIAFYFHRDYSILPFC